LEDFRRLSKLRERKYQEARGLDALYKSLPKSDPTRNGIGRSLARATQWYKIDDEEYKRTVSARNEFVNQSLENYLKSLAACDEFDNCLVRFFALWLEHSESIPANEAVSRQIDAVASWKFVGLLNQMMSRLLNDGSNFQALLSNLMRRICSDHPYHGYQHIFASCNGSVDKQDEKACGRREATQRVAAQLHGDQKGGGLFKRVWDASVTYHLLANSKVERTKSGKLSLQKFTAARDMNEKVSQAKIPPATLNLELRPAGDYNHVPIIVRFREEISIASGVSAPKILTARATDGNQYKQLVSRCKDGTGCIPVTDSL